MKFVTILAAMLSMTAPAAQSSVVPPVERGVWLSAQMMPLAISKGKYAIVADLLTSETIISSDDGKILAKGGVEAIAYLDRWYGSNNRVVSTYTGYASLVIQVERAVDRPWNKAYAMIISCVSGKIVRIMIINRNPNMP